jgi:2-polyprenyl-3-methyl-5-hydroxy-6-metoxy-1,4-benzoquinol methylase
MAELEEAVCQIANSLLEGQSHIKLLEAGCGSMSHVRFQAEVHAVGIDISKQQLDQNSAVREKILGDIQYYPLPKEEFDVVVCWMVLEHLPKPEEAMLNMFGSVKPRGLVILGFPNLLSIKGLVTKFTPFWFHQLFYRFMRYKFRPFPTYLRVAILPKKVIRFAEDNGFSVAFCQIVEGGVVQRVRSRFRLVDVAFRVLDSIVQVISLGKAQSLLLDKCAMILRKRAQCS